MARKTLSDFNYDYQAYANYLESPECANDDGYDTYADHRGNIYESDDWTKGHGHRNVNNGYSRDKDDDRSKGRGWKKGSCSSSDSQFDTKLATPRTPPLHY